MKKIHYGLYTFLAILFIWLSYAYLVYFKIGNLSSIGSFGDSFGVLNTLFSGLAFGALVYTIMLQHEELKLTREELKLTREEIKKSAKAQDDTQKAINVGNKNQRDYFNKSESNQTKINNFTFLNQTLNQLIDDYKNIKHEFKETDSTVKKSVYGYRALNRLLNNENKLENEKLFNAICIAEYMLFLANFNKLIKAAYDELNLNHQYRLYFLKSSDNFYIIYIANINSKILNLIQKPENKVQTSIINNIKKFEEFINIIKDEVKNTDIK